MIKLLNILLATIEMSAANVKGRHWTVSGSSFRSVHLVLDDVWKVLLDGADRVAETVRVLGGTPLRSMPEFIEFSTIPVDQAIMPWQTMVADTRNELNIIIDMVHSGIRRGEFDPTVENDLCAMTSELRHWLLFLDGMIEEWGNQ